MLIPKHKHFPKVKEIPWLVLDLRVVLHKPKGVNKLELVLNLIIQINHGKTHGDLHLMVKVMLVKLAKLGDKIKV